jgi:hypothetical protein
LVGKSIGRRIAHRALSGASVGLSFLFGHFWREHVFDQEAGKERGMTMIYFLAFLIAFAVFAYGLYLSRK